MQNLTRNVGSAHLKEIFGTFGEVKEAVLEMDERKRVPKGTAHVEYQRREEAEQAIAAMDGAQIDGNVISVRFQAEPLAAALPPPPPQARREDKDRERPGERDRAGDRDSKGDRDRAPDRDRDRDRDRERERDRERDTERDRDRGPARRASPLRRRSPPRVGGGYSRGGGGYPMRGRSPPRGGPPRGGGRGRSPPRGARRPSPPRRGSPPRRRYSRSRCQQHTASLCHPVHFSMFVSVCMSLFFLSVSACLSFSAFVLVCIRKSRDVQLSYDDTKSSDRCDNSILTSISEDNSMFTPSRIFH